MTQKIPTVPAKLPFEQRRVLEAMRESIEVGEGVRGDPLLRKLTIKDLVTLKMLTLRDGFSVRDLSSGGTGPLTPVYIDPVLDLSTPPKPTGFVVSGAISNMLLNWDAPTASNHAYTEVYRHSSDNLAAAVLLGTAAWASYADAAGPGESYYYWIRFVSTADVNGPYNDTLGTLGETGVDVTKLIESIQGEIDESSLTAALNSRITSIDDPLTGTVAAEVAARAQALIDEATARGLAIGAEAEARGLAIAAEAEARTLAIGAEATARGEAIGVEATARATAVANKVIVSATQPTGTTVGQIWIDSSNENRTYEWNGAAWVEVSDARIAVLELELNDPVTGVATKVTSLDGAINTATTGLAAKMTTVESRLDDPASGLVASADAIDTLQSTVNNVTTGVVATADRVTTLQASVDDILVSPFDANITYVLNEQFKYAGTLYKVTTTQTPPNATPPNATYYLDQGAYTGLSETVSGNSTAIEGLQTTVNHGTTGVAATAGKVATLESTVNHGTTGVAATSAAVGGLQTDVLVLSNASLPPGIQQGGYGDVRFTKNTNAGGGPNDGEIRVQGGSFYHPDGTKRSVTPTDATVNTALEGSGIGPVGYFYLMWSDATVATRFTGGVSMGSAGNVILVEYNWATGAWSWHDNNGSEGAFVPTDTDCLLATVYRAAQVGGITAVFSLLGTNANLPEDSADVTVNSAAFTTLKAQIDNEVTGLAATATTADTTYATVTDGVTGLSATAGRVLALETTVNNVDSGVSATSTALGLLDTRVGDTEAFASDTTLLNSAITIGGRNLLEGTDETTLHAVTVTGAHKDTFVVTTPVLEELEYTVSFNAVSSNAAQNIRCYFYSPNTTIQGVSSTGGSSSVADGGIYVAITDTEKRYWVTWKQSSAGSTKRIIVGRNFVVGTVTISAVKFEAGNKATAWTPAVEDVADAIGATSQAIETLDTQVQHGTTGLSATATKVTNLENTVNNETTGVSATSTALGTLTSTVNHGATGLAATAANLTKLDNAFTLSGDAGLIFKNPNFNEWVDGVTWPVGWGSWNAQHPVREEGITSSSTYAVRWSNIGTVDAGMQRNITSVLGEYEHVEIEMDVYLVSGTTFSGAGLLLDWNNGGNPNQRVHWRLDQLISSPVTGRWYTARAVVKRPLASTGTFSDYHAYLMANYGSLGSKTDKDIIFGRVEVRPASQTAEAVSLLESRVTANEAFASDSTLLNSSITISGGGVLSGAGGGQVTLGGLGFTGATNADVTADSTAHQTLNSQVQHEDTGLSATSTKVTTLEAEISKAAGVNLIRGQEGLEYSDSTAGRAKVYIGKTAISGYGLSEGSLLSFAAETKVIAPMVTALYIEWFNGAGSLFAANTSPGCVATDWTLLLLEGIAVPTGAVDFQVSVDNANSTGTGYARNPVLNHGAKSITGADTASASAHDILDSQIQDTETGLSATATRVGLLESTVDTAGTGLSAKVSTHETALTNPNGSGVALATRFVSLETAVNTPTTGLSAKVTNHEAALTDPDGSGYAMATRFTALESTVTTPGTGLGAKIATVETAIADPSSGLGALATKTTQLETSNASGNSGFDVAHTWHFDTDGDSEGWSSTGITRTVSGGIMLLTATSGDPILMYNALSITGVSYTRIRARVRRISGTSWQGTCYFANSGHGYAAGYYKTTPLPAGYVNGTWIELEWDMAALTAGGTDWVDNTNTGIRLDFTNALAANVEVDWIAIGRSGPGGSSAIVQTHAESINGLEAKYTVKIDVNGHVAGYGLAVDANNATPVSTMQFAVDKFNIVSPGKASLIFSADSATNAVVMDGAYIKNATISNAKIGNLAVDSAKMADLSVTTAKIAALAVGAAQIATAAITTAKIGDAAITSAKIGDASVDTIHVKDNAFTFSAFAYSNGFNRSWNGTYGWETVHDTYSTLVAILKAGDVTRISVNFQTTTENVSNSGYDTVWVRPYITVNGVEGASLSSSIWRYHFGPATTLSEKSITFTRESLVDETVTIAFLMESAWSPFNSERYINYNVQKITLSAFTARK